MMLIRDAAVEGLAHTVGSRVCVGLGFVFARAVVDPLPATIHAGYRVALDDLAIELPG